LVINTAAYTHVDRAETESKQAFDTNALGPSVIADACAKTNRPLLHVSTDYVFNGDKMGAYSELDPIDPICVYGQSKALGEQAICERLAEHIILRTSWTYGVYRTNFLKTIVRLAREKDQFRVVYDQRGCPTGTADLADAILAVLPRVAARDPIWGIY